MPTKFPCIQCRKPVKSNQKSIFCEICKLWVHFKCSNLTKSHFDFLATNIHIPFNCQKCRPLPPVVADEILNTPSHIINSTSDNSNATTSNSEVFSEASDYEFSDAHSSDFTFESDEGSDSELKRFGF